MLLLVNFHLLTNRQTPICSNYFPTWISTRKPEHNAGILDFTEEALSPGSMAYGCILRPMVSELWAVECGDILDACEGNKVVGHAVVERIFTGEWFSRAPPKYRLKESLQIILDKANELHFASYQLSLDNIDVRAAYNESVECVIHNVAITYFKNGGDVDREHFFDPAPNPDMAIHQAMVRLGLAEPLPELQVWLSSLDKKL